MLVCGTRVEHVAVLAQSIKLRGLLGSPVIVRPLVSGLAAAGRLFDTHTQTSYVVYVRIGVPARKHGVVEVDIWHAVRSAMRRVVMDEELTMLIGPACDGALLEIGVLDLDGDDPVVIHAMALRPKFYRFLG